MLGELLGDEAREDGALHADEVRELAVEDLLKDGPDPGVVSAKGEDAPASEEVEVLVALGIPEVGSLTANVTFVKADRAEHFHKGSIDVAIVKFVLLAIELLEPAAEIGVQVSHRSLSGTRGLENGPVYPDGMCGGGWRKLIREQAKLPQIRRTLACRSARLVLASHP
jgi:hypothetical protein